MGLGGISERRRSGCSSNNWNPMTGNRSFIKPSAQTKLKGVYWFHLVWRMFL